MQLSNDESKGKRRSGDNYDGAQMAEIGQRTEEK